MENSVVIPQTITHRITTGSSPLLGLYSKEPKAGTQRVACTPMFTAALFTIGKEQKRPECPSMHEWIKSIW